VRGFGKNYFTLASILAYSVAPRLHAQTTLFNSLDHRSYSFDLDEEESPPDEELLLTNSTLQQNKACHCNCFFRKIIRLILLLNHFIPRCPFYTKYFAFRRSGVHPPLYPFI
jgi:hypothetical protein